MLRNVRLIEDLGRRASGWSAAQDEERRKLERNIHDGVQQQLVALNVQLGLLARTPSATRGRARSPTSCRRRRPRRSRTSATSLAGSTRRCWPTGLAAALEAQARKAAVPTTIDADGLGRYPQEVEAAVYFSVLEALNDVAKYAGASRTRVELAQRNGSLEFAVRDDGRGFDSPRRRAAPACRGSPTGSMRSAAR